MGEKAKKVNEKKRQKTDKNETDNSRHSAYGGPWSQGAPRLARAQNFEAEEICE